MKRQSRAPAPRGSPCRGNGTAAGTMGPNDPAWAFGKTIGAKGETSAS